MIRIGEIDDPELRAKVTSALADRRGMDVAAVPDWFELDDHDFVDLLDDIRDRECPSAADFGDEWESDA